MSKKKRDRGKEQEQDQELELPDSTKDEVFVHQFLRKYGATPEEAIAFAKVYGNMIESIVKDIKADIKKELSAQKWVLIIMAGMVATMMVEAIVR